MALTGISQLGSKEAQMFVRALAGYENSPSGLAGILQAAKQTGVTELQTASMQLNRLVADKNGKIQGTSRFAEKAPAIYPSKAEVLADLLSNLDKSSNPRVKAFAADIAAAWMTQVRKDGVGIAGKYV